MMHRPFTKLAALFALVAPTLALTTSCTAQEPEPSEPWLEVTDDGKGTLRLRVAERTYTKEGSPSVTMIGAIHIADPRFYGHLTKTLEEFDIVLYEGVGPEGAGELTEDLSDEQRATRTESRIRLLAILLEQQRRGDDAWTSYPATIDALDERLSAGGTGSRGLSFLDAARTDGWGNPLVYDVSNDATDFTIVSLGADGAKGGNGVDRDLAYAMQPPLNDAELGGEPGLQQRMAKTFGLAFQGDVMSHDFPNHINADLSVDEVRDLLEARGGDGGAIFGMLDGSSGMATIIGTVLSIIEFLPGGPEMGKLMMMEMLANADLALAGAGNQEGMEEYAALMEVIINDRNVKVIEDLRDVLTMKRAGIDEVAIIYGAGHMLDLHDRLVRDLGYELAESDWNLAIRLNLQRAGIPQGTADMIRDQVRTQLESMRPEEDTNDN